MNISKVEIEPAHSVSMDSYKGETFEAQVTKFFPMQWIRIPKVFTHRSQVHQGFRRPTSIQLDA